MGPSIIVHGGAGSGKYPAGDPRFAELRRAVEAGMRAMRNGSAVDGVEAAVTHLEDTGMFNAGKGACLTSEGAIELDAAIMSGARLSGAGVGVVTSTFHPVSLSRWVMDNTKHVLIAGERTREYARLAGMDVGKLDPTDANLARFQGLVKERNGEKTAGRTQGGNTVGAVALGRDGVPAAAVSTGGMWMKLPGRIGDSAIIGAGIFADTGSGAACATGVGEEIIRTTLASRACDLMRKSDARKAARMAISMISKTRGEDTAGIITIDKRGRVGASFNTEAMGISWYDETKGRVLSKC